MKRRMFLKAVFSAAMLPLLPRSKPVEKTIKVPWVRCKTDVNWTKDELMREIQKRRKLSMENLGRKFENTLWNTRELPYGIYHWVGKKQERYYA